MSESFGAEKFFGIVLTLRKATFSLKMCQPSTATDLTVLYDAISSLRQTYHLFKLCLCSSYSVLFLFFFMILQTEICLLNIGFK